MKGGKRGEKREKRVPSSVSVTVALCVMVMVLCSQGAVSLEHSHSSSSLQSLRARARHTTSALVARRSRLTTVLRAAGGGGEGGGNKNKSPESSTVTEEPSKLSASVAELKYSDAYKQLSRNPILKINKGDAKVLLNNIQQLDPNPSDFAKNEKQVIESSNFLYKRLKRQKMLVGFGSIEGCYPEKSTNISPTQLEDLSGLSLTALTPQQRTTYWRLAGLGVCLLELMIGQMAGVDNKLVFSILPCTYLLFAVDQLLYKGASFEGVYRKFNPEYEQKIIAHEAGHFLLSYLLGVPVRACVTQAKDAMKYPELRGPAGTVFFDSKLAEEMRVGRLTKSSLDRLSVVLMGGIAAEAIKYGKAEGGLADEETLIRLLRQIQPPWNILRIQGQARWAVVQAILLIQEHKESYEALVKVLQEDGGVGDGVWAIEAHLPSPMPSALRLADLQQREKNMQLNAMVRHAQQMTWTLGGIGKEIEAEGELGAGEGVAREGEGVDVISSGQEALVKDAVQRFTQKMRLLERAVSRQELELPSDEEMLQEEKAQGGIWLNNLQSLKDAKVQASKEEEGEEEVKDLVEEASATAATRSKGMRGLDSGAGTSVPPALEGFEERLKLLSEAEGLVEGHEEGEVENVEGEGEGGEERAGEDDSMRKNVEERGDALDDSSMFARGGGGREGGFLLVSPTQTPKPSPIPATNTNPALELKQPAGELKNPPPSTPLELLRLHRGFQVKGLEQREKELARTIQTTEQQIKGVRDKVGER